MRRVFQGVLVALALSASAGIRAQDCAGFTDVLASNQFCPNVEWLKNRGITIGCSSSTLYCPTDAVTRLSMAVFMNRLGRALAVEPLFVEVTTGAIALTPGTAEIRCVTGDTAATNYPRMVMVNATLSGLSDASAVAWRGGVYFSTDSGTTWQAAPTVEGMHASSNAGEWSSGAATAFMFLSPLKPYRFALGVLRDDVKTGTTGNLADGRCQLTASVRNNNGVASPYDAAIAIGQGSAP